MKDRKDIPIYIKVAIKKLHKKYGYEQAFLYIENLKSPTIKERELMINYLTTLKKN